MLSLEIFFSDWKRFGSLAELLVFLLLPAAVPPVDVLSALPTVSRCHGSHLWYEGRQNPRGSESVIINSDEESKEVSWDVFGGEIHKYKKCCRLNTSYTVRETSIDAL